VPHYQNFSQAPYRPSPAPVLRACTSEFPQIDPMTCVSWRRVKRDNPRSTMRGLLAVELRNGMIVNDVSVLSTGRSHWGASACPLKAGSAHQSACPGTVLLGAGPRISRRRSPPRLQQRRD
jgi:hypothetical protein